MNFHSTFVSLCCAIIAAGFVGCATARNNSDTRCFELRTYYSPPGKLDDLHARFRDHTMRLFEKHGMQNVGYWVPVENTNNTLVYLMAYPSRAAREESWKAFLADPEWKRAAQKSEANGKIVSRVEHVFLQAADYSPMLKTGEVSNDGIFELRAYTTPEGKLADLDERFRKHTMTLFKRHGMKNWAYFHKTPDQPGAETTLIYFLAHASRDAAMASWDSFRKDPEWISAKTASEKNGSLTVKDGVKSVLLVPTDYSPTK